MSETARMTPLQCFESGLALMEEVAAHYAVPTAWIIELRHLGDDWRVRSTSYTRLVLRDLHSALSTFRVAVREAAKARHEDWRKNPLYNDCSELLRNIEQSCDLFYTAVAATGEGGAA